MSARAAAVAALALVVAAWPWLASRYFVFLASLVLVNAVVAIGLNMLAGYTNQLSFGHAGFLAIGAYTAALLTLHVPALPVVGALIAAGLVTAVIGVVFGVPCLRLHGLYLAMATLAFGVVITEAILNLDTLTRGADGLRVPAARLGPWTLAGDGARYYLVAAVAALMTAAAVNLARTRTGRAFLAIRESEIAAQAVGVPVARYKTVAFGLSAFYTGVAGGLFAFVVGFLSPDAFDVFLSVDFVVMIIVGGLGSVPGSIVGAALVTVLNDTLAGFQNYRPLVFGAILIACMLFMPGGVTRGLSALATAAAPSRRTSMRLLSFVLLAVVTLAAAPAAAETGVTDSEIVLGCSNSFSGPLAFTGEQATKFGVDLYFKVVNDAGGINGRKVRTIYYDDGYRPQDAVANTRKLVEQDGIFAVIAPQGTPPVVATLDYLESNKVPMLFPFQGSPVVRGHRDVFSGMTLYDRQARMMIDYLVEQRKYKTFAALYQDDEYGKAFLANFEKELARYKLKLVAAEPVKRGVNDVSAQIAKLQAARPQVTFLVVTPPPGAQALKERQKIGWTDTVMVSSGPLTDERYLALAGDAAEGVEGLSLWPDPVSSDLPALKAYREAMQKYFPKNEPNRYSLSGYFAAMLFTEGAKRVGRTLTREGLITTLEGIKGWDSGLLPPITIGPDHETQRQGFWVKVEKGHFKQLTDWLRAD
ncbi:MAG TPA: ABC transporter substrate-binding protein [Methylomirabilota bacterium]|nr:ABC transporter substrate-binding protein [Methylomirabilota bacterium]